MTDEQLIELYWNRSEDAIIETDIQYGRLCRDLSSNILNDALDEEECINDSYLSVWNSIPPKRPKIFCAFLCKIVRNISLSRLREKTAMKRDYRQTESLDELEYCFKSSDTRQKSSDTRQIEEKLSANELATHIDSFLESVSGEKRVIFVKRYFFEESIQDIAKQTGKSQGNIKTILFRLRKQLKDQLVKEGVVV